MKGPTFLSFKESKVGKGRTFNYRAMANNSNNISAIRKLLEEVYDPEVPVLSVLDLGIIRNIEINGNNIPVITITPTYSGCPAMDVIRMNIRLKLIKHRYKNVNIRTALSPA